MRTIPLLLVSLSLAGCSASAYPSSSDKQLAEEANSLASISQAIVAMQPAPPNYLFAVNKNSVATCVKLGYLLRKVDNIMSRSQWKAVISVPVEDTSDVYRYLRTEKVRLPVTLAPAAATAEIETLHDPVLFVVGADGAPRYHHFSRQVDNIDRWWDSVSITRRTQ